MADALVIALQHRKCADALLRKGDLENARQQYLATLSLDDHDAEAYDGLGGVESLYGNFHTAIGYFRRSLCLRPNSAQTRTNLGSALLGVGRITEAIEEFHRAIQLRPDFADAHVNLGYARLLLGEFSKGWEQYEWRLQRETVRSRHTFPQQNWRGEPLEGASIVLHAEQGLGDTIQFCRYAQMVHACGGRVILQAPDCLRPLLSGVPGVEDVIPMDRPVPEVRWRVPLPSLPFVFKTDLRSIPTSIPYMQADSKRLAFFREQMSLAQVNVGLVWAGNPNHPRDRHRSITLHQFRPIFEIDRVRVYSLQGGSPATERNDLMSACYMLHLDRDNSDFCDTAAAIMALDLVITVDTSVAHLAGALGKRVWVLVSYVPDWRWMLGTQTSPWYPSARLFRQPSPGEWDAVIAVVANTLRNMVRVRPQR
jgi:hypothetical protein